MTQILLVGADEPLLEGLVQSLAAVGHTTRIAHSLAEGREIASAEAPLVVVMDRALAVGFAGPTLGIPLGRGGALVLFHGADGGLVTLPHALQRHVLADLALPLERNRLVALIQSVEDRARATGKDRTSGATDELRRR